MKLVRNNPFLTFAVIGLFMWAIVVFAGLGYDDEGIRGIIWWVAEFFAIPYLLVGEGVSAVWPNGLQYRTAIIVIVGLLACGILDLGLKKFRGR